MNRATFSTNRSSVAIRIMREGLEEAVRKLDGCERFTLPDGIADAAVADGRPYERFLEHLLRLGLAAHRREAAS